MAELESSKVSEDVKKKIDLIIEKDVSEEIKFIQKNISRMDTLLEGLLKISALGRAHMRNEKVDTGKLVTGVFADFKSRINDSDIDIEIADLPDCMGDWEHLRQVFTHLINNAITYLNPGQKGLVRISGRKNDDRSIYCIEDNGIGISLEHQEKIFDIYYQLEPKRCPGAGLGLTIVRKILSMMHGRISVESSPGKGSRFYVSMLG